MERSTLGSGHFLACLLVASACGDDDSQGRRVGDFVRADRYGKLVLEIDSVAGYDFGLVDHVSQPLRAVVDKPGGVQLVFHDTLPDTPGRAWTIEDLDALASYRDLPLVPGTTSIHVVRVTGSFALPDDEGTVLGVSWGGDRVALFLEPIAEQCQVAPGACDAIVNSVLVHEVGHLLGLVDNGAEPLSDHRDPDATHGHHCSEPSCIMYWENDRAAIGARIREALGGDPRAADPLGFDAACKEDLAAIRSAP